MLKCLQPTFRHITSLLCSTVPHTEIQGNNISFAERITHVSGWTVVLRRAQISAQTSWDYCKNHRPLVVLCCVSADGEQKGLFDIWKRLQESFPGLSASLITQTQWNLQILTSFESFLLLTPSTVAVLTLQRCEPWKEKPSDFKGRAVLGLSQVMSHETVVVES